MRKSIFVILDGLQVNAVYAIIITFPGTMQLDNLKEEEQKSMNQEKKSFFSRLKKREEKEKKQRRNESDYTMQLLKKMEGDTKKWIASSQNA